MANTNPASGEPAVDIKVEKLRKQFVGARSTVLAIEELSFEVMRGEIFCVVGPSGCGKTTLLRILQGLIEPSSGTVTVDPNRRHQGTAYIQQSAALLPWRTVLQNAAIGLEIKGNCNPDSIRGVQAELERFGLSEFQHQLPENLSGGMRQRVDIVRALQMRPALLFCDEPFSAIDFVSRLDLNTKFKFMCKIEGVTVVFVTHNIEEAIFLGDAIAVLSRRPARVVGFHRPHLELFGEDAVKCRQSPSFATLFQTIWEQLGK